MEEFEETRQEETLDIERFEELDLELAAERARLLERRFADDPGSINQWLLLGPIQRKDGAGLESEILDNTRDLFPGPNDAAEIDGVEYTWTAHRQRHPVFDFSRIYASEASGEPAPLDRMTAYSACYIVCDRPMNDLVLKIGSDDEAILYLNGREIHRSTRWSNPPLDRDEIPGVRLEPGLNRLLFRVDNNQGQWGGSVRITGNDGNPVEGLTITLLPGTLN